MNTNVNDCFAAVDITIQGLTRLLFFFELVKHEAEERCNSPILHRKQNVPRRLNDCGDGYSFGSVHELYRKEYFEVIAS